jgi:hypothetical protein
MGAETPGALARSVVQSDREGLREDSLAEAMGKFVPDPQRTCD